MSKIKSKIKGEIKSVKLSAWAVIFSLIIGMLISYEIPVQAAGTTYYVDSAGGNDNNNGTSAATAWKTLNKVNAKTFVSGDKILFKAGSVWTGQLHPLGSGTGGNPIVIDMYGTGNKPIINGGGRKVLEDPGQGNNYMSPTAGAAVYLFNQEYWEINNLEVTNDDDFEVNDTVSERIGIYYLFTENRTFNHIYIKNCYIHDVDSANDPDGHKKYRGGIIGEILGPSTNTASKLNDVRIESNTLRKVDRTGLVPLRLAIYGSGAVAYPNLKANDQYGRNFYIAHNNLDSIGGDGILVSHTSDSVIEYNVVHDHSIRVLPNQPCVGIWTFCSINSIFQFNECYGGPTDNQDGNSYDCDYFCEGTTFQYNYSHDTPMGFMLFMGGNIDDVVRYNVSQNDGMAWRHLNKISYDTVNVYNNVFYYDGAVWKWNGNEDIQPGYAFYNNIFYNYNSNAVTDWKSTTWSNAVGVSNNLVYEAGGNHSANEIPGSLRQNPQFMNAGGAGLGVDTCAAYKLWTTSPCIDAGVSVGGNGGRDFFGNALYNGTPDIGIHEYSEELVYNPGFESGLLDPWYKWNDAAISGSNARTGNYCVRLGNGPASVEQVITVQPNTTYMLSGYARTPSGQTVGIGVKNYGGATPATQISSTTYARGTVTFTTGASNTQATIYLYHSSGTGNCYADDLSVARVNEASNPGFESGLLDPWYKWNDAAISGSNARTGNYCVRLGNGPASVEQVITVQPNTTYVLSGYARTPSGQTVGIGVKNYGGTTPATQISSTTYARGTVTFTTGANNTQATIYLYHSSGTGNCYADDIFVVKQ